MGTIAAKNSRQSKATQKKIQTQNMIIVALIIVIVVLLIVSGTAAWYIRTRSDSADIILSNPVNIYITQFEDLKDSAGNIIYDQGQPIKQHYLKTDILDEYNTKIYPGDKVKMKLGLQIGSGNQESSPAYVRVKLAVTYENIYTGETSDLNDFSSSTLIKYKNEPDSTIWEKVNFNKFKTDENGDSLPEDNWYVLKTYNKNGKVEAKIAYDLEKYEFVDGYIELDKFEITNKHANCKFHIHYVVEAIQVPNVPDPLLYEGYGPWWGFEKGDTDDIPGWESAL